MIHREATIKYKGYDPDDLKPQSTKRICCICDKCGRVRWISKFAYSNLCRKCVHKGENNGMFGKRHSKESREKMSNEMKGENNLSKRSDVKKKISKAKKGYKHTQQTREKISRSIKKGFINGRISTLGMLGKTHSEKIREKLSGSQRKRYEDPEERKKTSEAMKGENNGMFGKHPSEETREKMRQSALNRKTKSKSFDTSIELKIQQILKDNDYEFKTQYLIRNIARVDIAFPDKKIIIECDGDYWHNLPGAQEKDHRRDDILINFGWNVIRFWEHEINDNIDRCLEKFELEYSGVV